MEYSRLILFVVGFSCQNDRQSVSAELESDEWHIFYISIHGNKFIYEKVKEKKLYVKASWHLNDA
jgi:hypothetical protein